MNIRRFTALSFVILAFALGGCMDMEKKAKTPGPDVKTDDPNPKVKGPGGTPPLSTTGVSGKYVLDIEISKAIGAEKASFKAVIKKDDNFSGENELNDLEFKAVSARGQYNKVLQFDETNRIYAAAFEVPLSSTSRSIKELGLKSFEFLPKDNADKKLSVAIEGMDISIKNSSLSVDSSADSYPEVEILIEGFVEGAGIKSFIEIAELGQDGKEIRDNFHVEKAIAVSGTDIKIPLKDQIKGAVNAPATDKLVLYAVVEKTLAPWAIADGITLDVVLRFKDKVSIAYK